MEESLYHKIREETMDDKSIHKEIVKYIEDIRNREYEESHFPIQAGRATSPSLYKNYLKTQENKFLLNEFDRGIDFCMYNFKSKIVGKVMRN